jgi:hypothetical protein
MLGFMVADTFIVVDAFEVFGLLCFLWTIGMTFEFTRFFAYFIFQLCE